MLCILSVRQVGQSRSYIMKYDASGTNMYNGEAAKSCFGLHIISQSFRSQSHGRRVNTADEKTYVDFELTVPRVPHLRRRPSILPCTPLLRRHP